MITDTQPSSETSVTGIIKGIVEDFQKLVTQQVDLVRAEVQSDWRKTKQAATPIILGGGLLGLAALLFSFMFVHLLHWSTSPVPDDAARIPLWGCYGIIAAASGLFGAALTYFGMRRFAAFNPLPDQSAEALKENVKWLTNNR